MLIKRVYEVDPLKCVKCGGTMKIISFIERGQQDVVERILRHCGLWEGPIRTLAGARAPPQRSAPPPDEPEFVMDPEFLESERLKHRLERQADAGCELQLILDPDFL